MLLALLMAAAGTIAKPAARLAEPTIRVVYPKEGQRIGAVDSTFILGSIDPAPHADLWKLTINGTVVPVDRHGGFLAYLPITPGEFVFDLSVRPFNPEEVERQKLQKSPFLHHLAGRELYAVLKRKVFVPEPRYTYGTDTLRLGPEYAPPGGDMDLAAGDRLAVMFQGTPGCRAWFSIPGVADSVPMAETDPRFQPYWGEAVFGAGAVPDSLLIAGIYSGFYDFNSSDRADSTRLSYHLAPPDRGATLARLVHPPYEPTDSTLMDYMNMGDTVVVDSSSYRIAVNSPAYPFTVRFVDSVQIVRHGPRRGYLAIHQPKGVEALAVGRMGDWLRVKLAREQFGWVARAAVEPLAKGILPPVSYLQSIRTYRGDDSLLVEFPLAGQHAFKVIEADRRTVRLRLYGVTTDTDWIRYDFDDDLVDIATWSQPEGGVYEFTLRLRRDVWGYDTFYSGNRFYLQINLPPESVGDLKGKRIVIDPGHSSDPGAIGPTGYTEAEANLGISLQLQKELEKHGAVVIMTRSDTSHVDLYARPTIAKLADADLYVSVHNNALPDGVNPWANNGTSSYYYHPHSLSLARAIHARMIDATELPDHGLFHGNLAVLRATQYPAVLVECAFMLIPEQETALKGEDFRKKVAKAIREGIEDFLKGYEREN